MKTNYVTIRFLDEGGNIRGKEYTYFTNLELKPNDWVVVKVHDTYKCVLVCRTSGFTRSEINIASKWIVSKIDTEAYAKLAEQAALILDIKAKLHARKEQAEEMIIYQTLAKSDPEIAELMKQLHSVAPGMVPKLEE